MTKQKQMTEKELDQVSGGPHIRNFNVTCYGCLDSRSGVIEKRNSLQEACANGTTGQRQAQHIWTAGGTTG